MIIQNVDRKRVVTDYEIKFESGDTFAITIDPGLGDSDKWFDKFVEFRLAKVDKPGNTHPAETILVYLDKVVMLVRREREILDLTPEEEEKWSNAIKDLTRH